MNKFETKTYLYIEQMVEVQLGNCCLGYISLFLMLCRLNEQHSLCLYYNAIYVLSETAGTTMISFILAILLKIIRVIINYP